jgi:hypothetical protein
MDREPDNAANERTTGLCFRCEHSDRIMSTRGSTFYLCRLSVTDPRFHKYPRLPVLTCGGFSRRDGDH